MKLFQRYTRISLLLTLSVLVVGIAVLFASFRYILMHQVDEALELEQEEILAHVRQYNEPPRPVTVSDLQIRYAPAGKYPAGTSYGYQTLGAGTEAFRELTFRVSFKGQQYRFAVRLPLEQTETLLTIIAGITLTMLLAITLSIYALNRLLVQRLIAPFYHTIGQLKGYSVLGKKALQLPLTPIVEFTLLNKTLNEMTDRMQRDMEAISRFTAQAAHEIQTPLAIMRNQLEALLQTTPLTGKQAAGILELDQSIENMSRLFKSLLLLTRIESGQFEEAETVSIDQILASKLAEMDYIRTAKKLVLEVQVTPFTVPCNPYLAEVLLRNVLLNAMHYSQPAGNLGILLTAGKLVISNTASLEAIAPEDLFRPFYRNPNNRQAGTGLGLSIAVQIAERYGWRLQYHYGEGTHHFTLLF